MSVYTYPVHGHGIHKVVQHVNLPLWGELLNQSRTLQLRSALTLVSSCCQAPLFHCLVKTVETTHTSHPHTHKAWTWEKKTFQI